MTASSIEWTDATWNPTRGCSRVSEGCRNCYAERMASRNLPEMRSPLTGNPFAHMTKAGPHWTGKVELIPSKLDEPLHWKKPRRVFVNSMSDLFHEGLRDEAIDQVFAVMTQAHQHTFQALTKRPARMHAYLSEWRKRSALIALAMGSVFPKTGRLTRGYYDRINAALAILEKGPLPNVWLGVSVEDQATADERVPLLLQTPAAVRFVSYEPALGPVDFSPWAQAHELQPDLDWIIVGGESGPGARPFDIAWARSAVRQCRASGVACFVKQLGSRPTNSAQPDGDLVAAYVRDRKGGDPAEWPEDLRVREFPA